MEERMEKGNRRSQPKANASRWGALVTMSLLSSLIVTTPGVAAPREPLKSLTAKSMFPAFSAGVTDYALRDCAGDNVTISFGRERSTTLRLDGKTVTGTNTKVRMKADQLLTVKARLGKTERTWYVRCLPDDFPKLTAKLYQATDEGFYSLTAGWRPEISTWRLNSPYYLILDARGVPLWYMRAKGSPSILDHAPEGNVYSIALPEGISPSYGGREGNAVVETTLSGKIVRTIRTPEGDPIDVHALQVLPNGNLLLLTMPVRRGVDLSAHFKQLAPLDVGGGGTAQCDITAVNSAAVAYPSIREVTPMGEVVWSWDGWEHLTPNESALPAVSDIDVGTRTDCVVDLFHGNWASQSPDGSTVLLTGRFASATWAIDKASKQVKWKVGGIPTAQSLRIVGDPYGERGPAGQHGGSLDEQGRLLLFDNRRIVSEVSRGVLYDIDIEKRTATWLRTYEPVSQACMMDGGQRVCASISMGNAQHLDDGQALVSWGFRPGSLNVATRFDKEGKPVMNLVNRTPQHVTYHVTHVPAGNWEKAALRAGASSRKVIAPAWDSGLTWADAPSDAAGTILR
jgi:hypothetical protein